ncbi:MAG: alpha/beta hydrolase [Alteromonadaceae bacterium]|nr:alpha/beta hydrolase [Alteromonadaceae bacterium]
MYKKFDDATLEREYSPSSCVSDINIYIEQYIQYSQEVTNKALEENSVLMNLSYGDCDDQVLDLYFPIGKETNGTTSQKTTSQKTTSPKKLQIYIHGGYWQELSKDESSFAARNFQQHDCYFAVINYSLAPNASLTEIVEQNRLAIAWLASVAQSYGFDANEIYLSGSSAGAHLTMMMLQTPWHHYLSVNAPVDKNIPFIKGICAVSGIYDIAPLVNTSINKALQLSEEEVQNNSPIYHDITNKCPVILAYGDNETDEFKRQSSEMATKLKQQNVNLQKKEIADRNHFDVILDLASPNTWLCQQVFKQMNISA